MDLEEFKYMGVGFIGQPIEIIVKGDLLYIKNNRIKLTETDQLAIKNGFESAEQLINHIKTVKHVEGIKEQKIRGIIDLSLATMDDLIKELQRRTPDGMVLGYELGKFHDSAEDKKWDHRLAFTGNTNTCIALANYILWDLQQCYHIRNAKEREKDNY